MLGRALSYSGKPQEGLDQIYSEARILEEMGRPDEALVIFERLGALKDIERMGSVRTPPTD